MLFQRFIFLIIPIVILIREMVPSSQHNIVNYLENYENIQYKIDLLAKWECIFLIVILTL